MSSSLSWLLLTLASLTLALDKELPPPSAQEALGLLAALQQGEGGGRMYDLLQLAGQRRREELEEEAEELPMALPLQGRIMALHDDDKYLKDKRGSYMSLCHFKICNMGRKRNYWASWGRN